MNPVASLSVLCVLGKFNAQSYKKSAYFALFFIKTCVFCLTLDSSPTMSALFSPASAHIILQENDIKRGVYAMPWASAHHSSPPIDILPLLVGTGAARRGLSGKLSVSSVASSVEASCRGGCAAFCCSCNIGTKPLVRFT